MVAATWGAVAGAIITVGAEVAIAVGGKLSTELIFLEAASVGGLLHLSMPLHVPCWHF